MLSSLSLAVVLLLASPSADSTGHPCLCSALRPGGLHVNCSSANLTELPHLPPHTTELHMQDNRLTSVPPGRFDGLVGLRKISLSGNRFHCDCRIQYLRNWLLRNRAAVVKEPTCSSPASVAQKAITELGDDYFSSCSLARCADGMYSTMIAGMLCCLIVLLLWSLRLARRSTFTLYIDKGHWGFEADSLRSLKPKHRRRLHAGQSDVDSLTYTVELGKPPNNMELLPQVLDVLHKKHNIKIKAT